MVDGGLSPFFFVFKLINKNLVYKLGKHVYKSEYLLKIFCYWFNIY